MSSIRQPARAYRKGIVAVGFIPRGTGDKAALARTCGELITSQGFSLRSAFGNQPSSMVNLSTGRGCSLAPGAFRMYGSTLKTPHFRLFR